MRFEGWTGLGVALGLLSQIALILLICAPEDALLAEAQRAVREATDERWALQAERATPGWISGITLHNARIDAIEDLAASAGRSRPAEPALAFSSLSIRRRPLAALRGSPGVVFEGELYGGTLAGAAARSEAETAVSFAAKDLDLSQIPLSSPGRGLRAAGRLRAAGDLALRRDDVRGSAGRLSLQIEGFTLYIGLLGGISLRESVAWREATLEMEVRDGTVEVTRGVFASDLLTVTLGGGVRLGPTFRRTRLDLTAALAFSDELAALLRGVPSLEPARDLDGVYHFRLAGRLDDASWRQDRFAGRRAPRPPGRSGCTTGGGVIRDELGGLSDEERELRRAERLARMQERLRRGAASDERP